MVYLYSTTGNNISDFLYVSLAKETFQKESTPKIVNLLLGNPSPFQRERERERERESKLKMTVLLSESISIHFISLCFYGHLILNNLQSFVSILPPEFE